MEIVWAMTSPSPLLGLNFTCHWSIQSNIWLRLTLSLAIIAEKYDLYYCYYI